MRGAYYDEPLDARRVKLRERERNHPAVRSANNSVKPADAAGIERVEKSPRLMVRG